MTRSAAEALPGTLPMRTAAPAPVVAPLRNADPSGYRSRGRRRAWASDLLGVAGALFVAIPIALALATGQVLDLSGIPQFLLSLGIIAGIAGTALLVEMLLLAVRVPFIDATMGHDKALLLHRQLTGWAMGLLGAHGLFLILAYGLLSPSGVIADFVSELTFGPYLLAVVSMGLFLLVGLSSAAVSRRNLPHEVWFGIHLLSYAAVAISLPHQFQMGAVLASGVLRVWWITMFTALTFAIGYRLFAPIAASFEHRLRIADVRFESPDTVSYWVTGRHLDKLGALGGQFYNWRFWTKGTWWHSHPFSTSSAITTDASGRQMMRVTIRDLGTGTHALQQLPIGTPITFAGPYGTFSDVSRTKDDLVVLGAGVGIAPIRGLLDQTTMRPGRTLIVLRVSKNSDLLFVGEFEQLCARHGAKLITLVGPRGTNRYTNSQWSSADYADLRLNNLAPWVADADVYVCGSDGWSAQVVAEAEACGVPTNQIHVERF